jgi:hypothetical protein
MITDKNTAILVGKLGKVNHKNFEVVIDDKRFVVEFTKEFNSEKFANLDGKDLYVLVVGMLSNGMSRDFVYPTHVMFSKTPQKERRIVSLTGTVFGVYEYDKRYRVMLDSKNVKVTRTFLTVFKNRGYDLNKDLVGKKIMVDGILDVYEGKFSVIADFLYTDLKDEELVAQYKEVDNNSVNSEENNKFTESVPDHEEDFVL